MAWLAAMDSEESSIRAIHELVDVKNRDDARIRDMIRRDARDRWPSVTRAFTLRRQRALQAMIADWPPWYRPDLPPVPGTMSLTQAGLGTELWSAYRLLGGTQPTLPPGPRGWDAVDACSGILVELDEEEHFDRDRAATLELPVYARLPTFPIERYMGYCVEHEADAIDIAGFRRSTWTSDPAERWFGPSDPPGVLGARGSARWRQRAFGDHCRDLTALLGLPVSRIAVWDTIAIDGESHRVGDILDAWPGTAAGVAPQEASSAVRDLIVDSRYGGKDLTA